ncbi:putative oxidoreductase GLYR1 homolog [Trichonephila clavata]|uniref:Putative oxidoreductase GLYR1 homolog n=1 Tax=Trichonephila clavata TaxID=2740835 RepID=A0A8X6F9Z3_TRICU|nr:putative oxidoreductase GLYR1 homolog [Trichonephila clavata]
MARKPCSLLKEYICPVEATDIRKLVSETKDNYLKMQSQNDFKIGDLVWAKMKNDPFWPAKIASPPTVKGKDYTVKEIQKKKSSMPRKAQHYVWFFGREKYAWILDKNIVPHSEEMLNEVTTKKCRSYSKAIDEIIEASGSIVLNRKHVKKPKNMQKPSQRSDDCSARFFSIPSLQFSVRKPIDVESADVSTAVKEKYRKMKIGFLGLGMMGKRIVKNLLEAGHNVSVWNRTPEKCKESVDAGAHQLLSPADVVSNCDIIFCHVSGPEAVKAIVFGNEGILDGLEKCEVGTKGYVELTSIDVHTSQEIASAITNKGAEYLSAPISGSLSLAEEGLLEVRVAGDVEFFNTCAVYFSAMCSKALYVGFDVGEVTRLNLITKMMKGATTCAALGKSTH